MTDSFSTPDDLGEIRQSELHASLGESLAAQARGQLTSLDLFHQARLENAAGTNIGVPGAGGELDVFSGQPLEQRQAASQAFVNAVSDTAMADAKARVKQEGLEGHLKLPDQPSIKSPVLDLMIQHAHEERDREVAIASGPHGFMPGALGLVTSLGVGMMDPLNMAAFSVPVLGEARWGKMLANAGDSIAARAGVRAVQGAAQGAVGTALLQPVDWWLHTQDGQDYTMADALKSVVMGAGMGAGFHAGFGAVGDLRARGRGAPLPGSPEDLLAQGLMTGTHVHADQLAEEGVPLEQVPGITTAAPVHPAEVLADLPPAAREDAFKATVAYLAADRPARGAEMLQIAANHDPRIAESIEAFHGSPHDFEQFDLSKIGIGEGAQAYGHGLYFAENEGVARSYRDALADSTIQGKKYDPYNALHVATAQVEESGSRAAAIKDIEKAIEKVPGDPSGHFPRVLAILKSDRELPKIEMKSGALYKVRINANHEHFLDWDKPLSEQSKILRDALPSLIQKYGGELEKLLGANGQLRPAVPGQSIYEALSKALADNKAFARNPPKAADILSQAGIPGIKYLDQGSRGAGDGTRNFVVFNDKHIEITHKNGEPVKREQPTVQDNARAPLAASHGERAAAAAEDPRWRELADVPPPHSTPEAISESKAADAVAEPASVTPKAMTAIEQAAKDAEEAWRKVEGTYTEAERAQVNDALAKLDLDRKDIESLITEGAACLAAAGAEAA